MNYIANIDTICILINIENYETFNKKLFEFLSNEKEKAKILMSTNSSYKHLITLNDMTFQLLATSYKGYSFILKNNSYELKIAKFKPKIEAFYPIQVRFSSQALWSLGISDLWSIFYNWVVETFGNIIDNKVCRLDLSCHISNVDFISNYNNVYKGDFKKLQVFYTGKEINSICFGSRKNKNIYCRIYNKTLEINETKKKNWFIDIWKNNNLDINNVWNIEFEIKSDFFRKYSLSSLSSILNSLNDIWIYCTSKWLVKIDRTNKRVERCKINSYWIDIQNCYKTFHSQQLIERSKQQQIDADKLIPSIVGNITSYSAMKNTNDINLVFSDLLEQSKKYLDKKQTTFKTEVNNKIKIFNQ